MKAKLAAGNWKMNGKADHLSEIDMLCQEHASATVDIVLCPPATLLSKLSERLKNCGIKSGGQDCHAADDGAFTGDISAPMLRDAGAAYVIVGHSERRDAHEETSEMVRAKARAAQKVGLTSIICLGESLAQREAENTLDIIGGQLSASVPDSATGENTVIAYEPIWAIGTGLTPSTGQIDEVHQFMRARLEGRFGATVGKSIRLLYGGSVKAENAGKIFSIQDVDGALVGGASLTYDDFSPIIKALENAVN